jgi:protein gp37
MAENSNIEWTDHTFNPWIGCQKVSPGCDHCYAETWDARGLQQRETRWGPHAARTRTSAANWRKPLAWNKAAQAAGKRARVFCASLADVFDNHASILPEWRAALWQLIAATPHLDWLLLTKRPQNIAKMLPEGWGDGWPNVWLGTTVENQTEADRRIPHLLATPAAVRFLSCEPLLGPVDLTRLDMLNIFRVLRTADDETWPRNFFDALRGKSDIHPIHNAEPSWGALHWIIVGGESGPNARPMHPDWARSLRDQCGAAGVPFFFKQWGQWGHALHMEGVTAVSVATARPGYLAHPHRYRIHGGPEDGQCFESLPEDHLLLRVGKRAAGRLLDGREWNDLPQVAR